MSDTEKCFLGVGGNSEQTPSLFRQLHHLLGQHTSEIAEIVTSSTYRTDPYGFESDNPFYNCVIGFEFTESPKRLLSYVNQWEMELGRIRGKSKFSDRTIDIDILLFGNATVNEADLTIPHYDLFNRDFFLIPLIELSADIQPPNSINSLKELLLEIPQAQRTYPKIYR